MADKAVQIIDAEKHFSNKAAAYLTGQEFADVGLQYHLISVFGSQSSGKSTLLNALFDTEFGVMDETCRGQTTHGIWLGRAKSSVQLANGKPPSPLLVLDVEGTDGRERGEDQDFERKAALFALASSEVLIVNLWETQIGLYQGANLALLKTVFEVNLSLFQISGLAPRSRILFVIRDHTSQTPLENLANMLRKDLEKFWQEIAKPTPALESSSLSDFFDLAFASLPHMRLENERFKSEVASLRKWFFDSNCSDYVFNGQYHRRVPLDGWSFYASNIWQQIEENKDLDLPTQQILVARFRCREIADESWSHFEKELSLQNQPFGSSEQAVAGFGVLVRPQFQKLLEEYEKQAAKYDKTVYNEQRDELLARADSLLSSYLKAHLQAVQSELLAIFCAHVAIPGTKFSTKILNATTAAKEAFAKRCDEASIDNSAVLCSSALSEARSLFETAVQDKTAELRAAELRRRVSAIRNKLRKILTPEITRIISRLEKDTWSNVYTTFNAAVKAAPGTELADTGATTAEQQTAEHELDIQSWDLLESILSDVLRPDNVVLFLRERFEKEFMYGGDGLPIMWTPKDDIKSAYTAARDSTLSCLGLLARAELSSGEIMARSSTHAQTREQGDDEVSASLDFSALLTPLQQDEIRTRFQRSADTMYMSTKRSVTQTAVHIPRWVYGIILVLGWNEFMAVLRNPFLCLLLLLVAGGVYSLWRLDLMQPALVVAKATLDKTDEMARQQLRSYLLADSATVATRSSQFDASATELHDLEPRRSRLDEKTEQLAADREHMENARNNSAIADEDEAAALMQPTQTTETRRRSSALRGPNSDLLMGGTNKLATAHRQGSSSLSATKIPSTTGADPNPATLSNDVKLATNLRKLSEPVQ